MPRDKAKLTKIETDKLWNLLIPYRAAEDVQDYGGSRTTVPIFQYIDKLLIKRYNKGTKEKSKCLR